MKTKAPMKKYVAVVYGTLRGIPFRLHLKSRRAVERVLATTFRSEVIWL